MKISANTAMFAAAVLVAGTIAVALLRSESPSDSAAPVAKPVLTAAVATPQLRRWSDDVVASGRLVAWEEALIGAEPSGLRLVDIRVDVGDRVKKGQLLAQFDTAPVQAELNERIAALAETQALLVEAEENARRGESLRNTGALSHQVITQYITRAQAVRAQVDSARARVDSFRLRLQQTRVVAPDDGVISSRTATLGSVPAGGDELFRLIRQNRIEWHAEVTAMQVRNLAPGQAATLSLPDGATIGGVVRQISPAVAADLTTTVYVRLNDGETAIARIGMYLQGAIATGASEALTVPASSVVVRDGREYVFTLATDDTVAQASIKTGRRHGNEVEIVDGLSTAQIVVTQGGGFLNDGDLVRVEAGRPSVARTAL